MCLPAFSLAKRARAREKCQRADRLCDDGEYFYSHRFSTKISDCVFPKIIPKIKKIGAERIPVTSAW